MLITVLRRFYLLTLAAALSSVASGARAQTAVPAEKKQAEKKSDAGLTAEGIAEAVVAVYGGRGALEQIRRTGVERGRISRTATDGTAVEIEYERSYKRGETSDKDKIRVDQKRANLEYSLIFNDGRLWGVIKGTSFAPRQEDVSDFDSARQHGIENLLRYKENGATLNYVGKDKQKNIDMWVLDLTEKGGSRTRYYISSQTGKVLWLEYETPQAGGAAVKYRRTFHDYRVVQGTRVPYRSVLYANDKRQEEAQILTVTYGVKMEDSRFKSEEAANTNGN